MGIQSISSRSGSPTRRALGSTLLLASLGLISCGERVVGWPADTDLEDSGEPENLPPEVVWTSPADGETLVSSGTSVFVNFSEGMDPLSLNTMSFTIQDGTEQVEGSVFALGSSASFSPDVALRSDTLYQGMISAGATDASGLAMESDYTWTFTTDVDPFDEPPRVTVNDPFDGEEGVSLDVVLTAAFSEALSPASISETSFLLSDGASSVPGAVSYNPLTLVASFTPDSELLSETTYTALVTTEVIDLEGNPMVASHSWSFETDEEGEEPSIWVPVELGSLENFVAVSGAGLTNSNSGGVTTLTGDVGLSPTATCLGDGSPCTATNPIIIGTLYANDAKGVADQAKVDLTAAYVDAMARPPGTTVNDISEMVLAPGVYSSASTMSVATGGTVTLDAGGDPNAVWIFQVGSSLTINNNAAVLLINGAKSSNVFWAVFSSSTIGSNVSFHGTVFAGASNSVGTGSSVVGRLLCTTGQITLLANTITLPPL